MENREMQEEMFRAMFRLKQLNMGGMLKEISVGEYKILEMCSGCPQCGARENGIYVSSMAAQMKVSSPAVSRLLKSMEGKDEKLDITPELVLICRKVIRQYAKQIGRHDCHKCIIYTECEHDFARCPELWKDISL